MLNEKNEYHHVLDTLYSKSLVLESPGDFNQVLYFYFMDAIAHIDFSACILAYNYHNVRNKMNMEYMRWRIEEEKKGDRVHFPGFINWLKENHPDKFGSLPSLWREIYDDSTPAGYRSFRISINPNNNQPTPANQFILWIEEFFSKEFIKSLYSGASLDILFRECMATQR